MICSSDIKVSKWQSWDLNTSLPDSKAILCRGEGIKIRKCPTLIPDKEVDVEFTQYL